MARKECSGTQALEAIKLALHLAKELNLKDLVSGTLLGLKDSINELENVHGYPDPRIEFEIAELRQKLEELKIMFTKGFLPSCKSVAKYAAKKEQFDRISADLRAGKKEKLYAFLDILEKRFKLCHDHAAKFKSDYDDLKKSVGVSIEQHGGEQVQLDREVKTAKERKLVTVITGSGLSVLVAVSAAPLAPTIGVSLAYLVFCGGIVGGVATAGVVTGMNASLQFKQQDLKLMVNCCDRIKELDSKIHDTYINHLGGVYSQLQIAEEELKTYDVQQLKEESELIIEALEDLKVNMEKVLENIKD